MREETLSTSYLYRGRVINIRQDRVKLHEGKTAFREVVEHPGAVAILVFNQNRDLVLVRQHRQPAGGVLLEIPAGKIEPAEEPLDCAKRELLEETGLCAEQWEELFLFYPSPGFCDEQIYLFKAEEVTEMVSPTEDPEENLDQVFIPLDQAYELISKGEIKDGKTIIAIQHALINCQPDQ